MQTELAPEFQGTAEGREAEAILRKCVHCGFCTATCPTYQLLGDELDGPRGRIYLIKQVLEGKAPTRRRSCTWTAASPAATAKAPARAACSTATWSTSAARSSTRRCRARPLESALRWTLKEGLPSPLFGPAMKLGQAVRGLLPRRAQGQGAGAAGRPAPGPRARMRARC